MKATCDFDGVFVEHPLSFDNRFEYDLEKDKEWKKNRLNFLQQKPIKRTHRLLSYFDEKHIVTGRPPEETENLKKWFETNNIKIASVSTRHNNNESSFEIIRKYKIEKIKSINPDAAFEDDIDVLKELPEHIIKFWVKESEIVIL